jgi:hypothetical protein
MAAKFCFVHSCNITECSELTLPSIPALKWHTHLHWDSNIARAMHQCNLIMMIRYVRVKNSWNFKCLEILIHINSIHKQGASRNININPCNSNHDTFTKQIYNYTRGQLTHENDYVLEVTQNSCLDISRPFPFIVYAGHLHISSISNSTHNLFWNSNGYHLKMQELNYPFVTNL